MQTPVQVSFRGMDRSDAVEAACLAEAEELERFYGRMTSCSVVVERPHHRQRKGHVHTVRIELGLPGARLVVRHAPPPVQEDEIDLFLAVRRAFATARRRLEDHVRRLRNDVKHHEAPGAGRVKAKHDDFGFLVTPGGEDVYFHRNAVLDDGFDALEVGDEVRFHLHDGHDGPQASSVRMAGRHHHIV